ncbi:glycoside hydrolase family 38 C-terminal domain-containing protein [Paenibacillus sacheonensis]|uniref:Alpha-mannosidase n=1 Tax=Paenibacillus sacheonensis TaxID=742054 RepID=A0A7X4YSE2_9BACL|nr:alpha-mannosidase [Paenibacillus sacheonensis]MBM7566761.1 alpha-mannosidase [Paenibacillus sacheonensis]NBC71663.1 alpha-mannosidase [Paenibacillus sacheonensis]
MAKLHLLSNAHLDPVWQWEWEEGAAAAVSTFRAAAEFCREYDGYIFNHNEVILYRWIEEYEPELFKEIQELVALGRWNIMGGWYLQPDCNMPSGESIVRQMLHGRAYFLDKFGARPTTAINFDSFGHSRGLVQLMAKAGFDSYLFMRPDDRTIGPDRDFRWVGLDGSEVLAHQTYFYNTQMGKARQSIQHWLDQNAGKELGIFLWGVGNHGGGPSRQDLDDIGELMRSNGEVDIVHSTPEAYFADLAQGPELKRHENDLNPRFIGCYTSMIRIKQKHRLLENELYLTEKMLSAAAVAGKIAYPKAELREAAYDLMTAQFHDILPGSSVQPAEDASLRLLGHGLEIVSRLKARAFFALAAGERKAGEGEYPILVYNPHPFPVKGIFACEFMLADQNWKPEFSNPIVYRDGVRIPSQSEKEQSNINLDWRKRVVFEAELAPSSMNRFDCRIEMLPARPEPSAIAENGRIVFNNGTLEVIVNTNTGLLDDYKVNGVSYLKPGAFLPVVVADNEDPWRMDTNRFEPDIGSFQLMDRGAGSDFSGLRHALLPSVRIVEDGEVRTVVEAMLAYNQSKLVLTYKLPKRGSRLEVHARVYWNEKDKLLKLSIPTAIADPAYCGQTIYGVQELDTGGQEAVAQKWTASYSRAADTAVTLINNGTYGSDFKDGAIRPTLLRSPGYTTHPIMDRPLIVQDRFSPRIDQGEREFTFWLNVGTAAERLAHVDREAAQLGEAPYALSFFPTGRGEKPLPLVELKDDVVQLGAFKAMERENDYILRLHEPTGSSRETEVSLPALGISNRVRLSPFEVKTYRVSAVNRTMEEISLMEGM